MQPPRVRGEERQKLVWVRRDWWERKDFRAEDCYPMGDGDVWGGQPLKLNFAEDF
jgi:hypothetical protein